MRAWVLNRGDIRFSWKQARRCSAPTDGAAATGCAVGEAWRSAARIVVGGEGRHRSGIPGQGDAEKQHQNLGEALAELGAQA